MRKGSLSANWGLIVPKPLFHSRHALRVRVEDKEREPFGELGTDRPQTPFFIDLFVNCDFVLKN